MGDVNGDATRFVPYNVILSQSFDADWALNRCADLEIQFLRALKFLLFFG